MKCGLEESCDWELIGYAGFKEEGKKVNLYQCFKCKTVCYDTEPDD